MNTIERLTEMMTTLERLDALGQKPKRKIRKKILKLLADAREAIWQCEEVMSELEAEIQDTRRALITLQKRQNDGQTAVS